MMPIIFYLPQLFEQSGPRRGLGSKENDSGEGSGSWEGMESGDSSSCTINGAGEGYTESSSRNISGARDGYTPEQQDS
jgi:hypothetical protein